MKSELPRWNEKARLLKPAGPFCIQLLLKRAWNSCCPVSGWLKVGRGKGFMVANGVSRGDACCVQTINKQGFENCQISRAANVGWVTAEDHHLGSRVQAEDGVHDGVENTRVYGIVDASASGVRHPNETLWLVGLYGSYPIDDCKNKWECPEKKRRDRRLTSDWRHFRNQRKKHIEHRPIGICFSACANSNSWKADYQYKRTWFYN